MKPWILIGIFLVFSIFLMQTPAQATAQTLRLILEARRVEFSQRDVVDPQILTTSCFAVATDSGLAASVRLHRPVILETSSSRLLKQEPADPMLHFLELMLVYV